MTRTHRLSTSVTALLALLPIGLAHAQTVVESPVANPGTVVAVPGGPSRNEPVVVIASVVDTTGNADNAKKALDLAYKATGLMPGYSPMPAADYPTLAKNAAKAGVSAADWAYPFTATDYQKIGKATKATRALSFAVTPAGDGFEVTVELYDTKLGALTGLGRGTSAAGTAGDAALSSAISAAVQQLSKTATLSGIVISKPSGGGNYVARVSLGTLAGARGGARVEYLNGAGEAIAFGTLFDIAAGEGLATIAPETAYPDVFVNQRVRLINNPLKKRALATEDEQQNKDFDKFQRSFALQAAGAIAAYYIAINVNVN